MDVRWVDRGTEKRLLMMPYSFRGKNRYGVAVFLNQNSIPDDMNLLTDIIRDKNTCSNIIYLESNYEGIPAFCEIDRAGMLMKTPSSHWGIIIAVEKNKGIILWNGCYKLNFPQKQVFRKFEIQQCNDFVGGDVLVWPDLSNVNIQMLKEHNYKNEIMVTH
ncbi:hypothetical protein SDC9_200607 [bioreactor metagenome]|uniref:Uncharacterized protein n=1 Tax=bioreactor metagenome TaxID=1076179 RepID=A0A645IX43_9ZZZZ